MNKIFLLVTIFGSLYGCQSNNNTNYPPPKENSKIAIIIDFDETCLSTKIGNSFMHKNIKTEKQKGWDLENKLGKTLLTKLQNDPHNYEIKEFSGLALTIKRRLQGGSIVGYTELPLALSEFGFGSPFRDSKTVLKENLENSLGIEYELLKQQGFDYLIAVRQLPIVPNESSHDIEDRSILNNYGFYSKCDKDLTFCEETRGLLRANVDVIDLKRLDRRGSIAIGVDIPMPANHFTEGKPNALADQAIDKKINYLNTAINNSFYNWGLLSTP